jgi:hypothetical protein
VAGKAFYGKTEKGGTMKPKPAAPVTKESAAASEAFFSEMTKERKAKTTGKGFGSKKSKKKPFPGAAPLFGS